MPIIVVTGKEIEKIKGDYESYLSGLNMVGKIDYSQYSQLYDEGTKHIQRAYELGKSELEKENAELKKWQKDTIKARGNDYMDWSRMKDQLTKAKELLERLITVCKIVPLGTNYDVVKKAEQFLKGENIILEDAQAGNSPFDADEIFNKEMKAYTEGKVK